MLAQREQRARSGKGRMKVQSIGQLVRATRALSRRDCTLAIGYPVAGEGWNYTGHLDQWLIEQHKQGTGAGEHLAQFGAVVFHPGQGGLRLDGSTWRGAGILEPRRTDW